MLDLKIYEEKMEKAIDVLKREFSGLRTGRASTSLLDPISVEEIIKILKSYRIYPTYIYLEIITCLMHHFRLHHLILIT